MLEDPAMLLTGAAMFFSVDSNGDDSTANQRMNCCVLSQSERDLVNDK